jgi:ketosteroid isomerase-like protein
MNVSEKEITLMRGRVLIAVTLVGISFSILGAGAPASGALRIDTGADLQADAETVRQIEEAFNRAEEAIGEKDLDALMKVYAETYRYQDLTKEDMRKIWKGFFEQYDRISTLHAFSRIVVKPGKHSTAQITCTGALWATSDQSDQRVNLSAWAGDIHHLIHEHGTWRIVGQGRNAPNRPEFGQAPPPLF